MCFATLKKQSYKKDVFPLPMNIATFINLGRLCFYKII